MEIALAQILGPMYLAIGLSILIYAGAWKKLMGKYEKDHFMLLPMMFFVLIIGLILVNMYNVWKLDVWLIITITGWAMIAKSVFYLLLPGSVIKWALRLGQNLALLYIGGAISVIAGGALGYYGFFFY